MRYLFVVFTLLMSACSSLHKKADKAFEAGEYPAAASLYEQVLRKDPSDATAIENLSKARQHMIDDRLLQVRQAILANNLADALDKFETILNDEQVWKLAPSGPAFSTQNDVAEDLFKWSSAQIHAFIKDGKPLKAKVFLDTHNNSLTSGNLRSRADALDRQVRAAGQADCMAMKSGGNGPYANEFVKKYCLVWGDKEKAAAANSTALSHPKIPGYGQINLLGDIKDLPSDTLATLSDSLLKGLKQTQFFVADGPALKVNLSGAFINQYSERQGVGVFAYSVQIPYQELQTVSYQERVPYTEFHQEYNSTTQQYQQVPTTEYRWETRYRQEAVTRYRSEPRTMTYPETQFSLKYSLAAKAVFMLDGVSHVLPLEDQLEMNDNYHQFSDSAVGLRPKAKAAPTAFDWLNKHFNAAGSDLSDKVASAWDNKYCRVPAQMNAGGQMESILKCISGTHKVPEFAENWFMSKFGLSFKKVSSVIGLGAIGLNV